MSPAKSPKTKKKSGTPNKVVDIVRELAEIVESHTLSELHFDGDAFSVTLRRGGGDVIAQQPVVQTAPAFAPSVVPQLTEGAASPAAEASEGNGAYHEVTSPFVGTFYRAPNPDAEPYVEVGQRVEKGQILCIVEAMKLMNEIEADQAGVIAHVLVENAEPVEYGQALFKISPG